MDNGYKTKDKGGNIEVLPIKNPDIFTLMLKKELDGAWVPEPWGEKLIREANSKIFLDERDLWKPDGKFTTGLIVVRTDFLENNHDIVKKLLESHIKITEWINENKEEAIKKYNIELKKLTAQTLPEDELKEAFNRLDLTFDPLES